MKDMKTNTKKTNIISNYITCGLLGWCLEVFWTGIHSFFYNDCKLMGTTSLLMFPIYGLACLINPLCKLIKKHCIFVRGIFYTICIFITEYICGKHLKKLGICPWDYSSKKYNINGLIRLDYAPAWFIVGLIYEKVLNRT